ncbi:MAG: TetR/AcrR family transcriptional regulator [Lachnospiraceae bacterium]|nr:TetR/AcrR family transcriptional regulator [Lachnospiraceae bacterium]
MARYQKGAYKRDIILYNAKYLFYKKGIAGTTIREIAERSEDPVSLVHYYFKKKEDIVQQIYLDFLGNIDLFVYSALYSETGDTNVLLAHTVTQLIYYDIIMKDPRNMRVYQESLVSQSNAAILNTYIEHVYRKILEDMELNVSEEFFQACISIDFGARREILNRYYDGELTIDATELVLIIIRTFPLVAGIPNETVTAITDQALNLYRNLDIKNLKFLV